MHTPYWILSAGPASVLAASTVMVRSSTDRQRAGAEAESSEPGWFKQRCGAQR